MKKAMDIVIALTITGATLAAGWSAGENSITINGLSCLLLLALGAQLIQWTAYIPAVLTKTEKFYDLVGSLTYITLTLGALYFCAAVRPVHGLQWLMAGCVLAWAARLGSYLFMRVHKDGKDGRFDQIKMNPAAFLVAWTLQGFWTFIVPLPVLILLLKNDPLGPINGIQVAGLLMWVAGFAIEAVADSQKAAFRNSAENRGRWINTGLWAKAQHPNYFGEILLWTGLVVVGIPVYEGLEWLAVISPIITFGLLTRVSGVPMIRARNEKRWGDDPGYQAYLREVPLLLPIGRKNR